MARELGVTDQTLYNWKSKYGGMDVSDANAPAVAGGGKPAAKEMVADLSPDKEALKTVIRKTAGVVSAWRDLALLMTEHQLSERHACRLLELNRSTYR